MTLVAHRLSQWRGGRALFEEVSFTLLAGQVLWVRGANGTGKTSLLRLLAGLVQPAWGEVRWGGEPLQQAEPGLYVGHRTGLKDDLGATDNLRAMAALAGQPCDGPAAKRALATWGVPERAGQPVRVLSQGQRQRVALARLSLPATPALWILDEPYVGLDSGATALLTQRLGQHLQQGGVVVVTSHQAVSWPGQRSLVLQEGRPRSWQLH